MAVGSSGVYLRRSEQDQVDEPEGKIMAGRVGRTKAVVSYLSKCAHATVMGLFLVVVCIYAIKHKLPERSTMIALLTGAAIGGAFSPWASWLLRGMTAAYRPWRVADDEATDVR